MAESFSNAAGTQAPAKPESPMRGRLFANGVRIHKLATTRSSVEVHLFPWTASPDAHLTMESLPAEVLDLIAEYVHDTHEPSLYALASVSKCCRSAASAYMFRNIHINWSTPKRLDRDVDQWCKLLRHYNASKHVRRLRIDGRFSARAIGRLDPCELAELDNKNSDWPSLDEEIFGEKPRRGIFWSRLPLSQVKDSDWRPLVRLIEATPSLHDLIFDHKMQFPACLLQALHEVIPACRLHLLHFGLRSLTQSEMDPHEMAIATSPCLHAIQVHYPNCKIDSKGEDDYNEEAAMCMAAGLAPNLKRVEMIGSRTASSAALSNSHSTPRKPWSGFSKQMSNITPGTLHHLSIDEDDDDQTLEEWTRHVDFSKLKSLEFSFSIGEADLRWLISRCHFHALSELTLTLYGPSYDGFKTPTDTVSAFFSALPPLRRLDLAGDLEHMVLDALLIRHGPSLRSLTLSLWTLEAPPHIEGFEPFTDFTQSHIQQIHECCPNLEDLTLPIRRTFGKPPESLLYRTFGAFPKLRKLTLILNASSATPDGGFGTAASNVLAVGGLLDPR